MSKLNKQSILAVAKQVACTSHKAMIVDIYNAMGLDITLEEFKAYLIANKAEITLVRYDMGNVSETAIKQSLIRHLNIVDLHCVRFN